MLCAQEDASCPNLSVNKRLVSDPARTDDLYGAGAFGDITTVFLCKPTPLTPRPNYPLVVSFARLRRCDARSRTRPMGLSANSTWVAESRSAPTGSSAGGRRIRGTAVTLGTS